MVAKAGETTIDYQRLPDKHDAEVTVKRNPHPDFGLVQASRPDWDKDNKWKYTKTADPAWKYGTGANDKSGLEKKHIAIDPYGEGRPSVYNYKLMISGIIPRPIGFISTRSADGESTNLAPYSYFQMFNHDPPIFGVGFAGGIHNAKDTLKNLLDTKECTINIISDKFAEAANATSMDLPYGMSEWSLSGLTPVPGEDVKACRVKESVFSIEGRLVNTQEFESRSIPGKKTGVLALIEGVKFWVREDALNEDKNIIDPAVLRPIARLGGITYGRVTDGFEILRPIIQRDVEKGILDTDIIVPKVPGQ